MKQSSVKQTKGNHLVFKKSSNKPHNHNYLQLLYREVIGILLSQGFPRPILLKKHPERKKKFPKKYLHTILAKLFFFKLRKAGSYFTLLNQGT